jgi:undecaprenyl-diphosphatase
MAEVGLKSAGPSDNACSTRSALLDFVLLVKAAIMGVVEGLTEFLPISSTGHLILTGSLLGFNDDKSKVFEIAIQSGAILAVIIVYWEKIRDTLVALPTQRQAQRFVLNVLVGFLPAAVIGLLAYKAIKAHLFNAPVVAGAFIVGALVILWAERRQHSPRVESVDDMTLADALKVGFVQCLGMIPGTSRSGATIIGGMLLGLSRKAATEFSFFLAIPTLLGATVYSLYKERSALSMEDVPLFAVGFFVSFVSAWFCVRWLLRYISSHSFSPFAWYRIAFGIVVLLTAWSGLVSWAA